MRLPVTPISLGAALFVCACSNNTLPDFARGGPSLPSNADASSGVDADSGASAVLPAALKGYELYAWSADNGLHFTLITGTNRAKTLEEVMVDNANVIDGEFVVVSGRGPSALERVLERVPAGTEVTLATLDGLPALDAEHGATVESLVAAHNTAGTSDAGSSELDTDKLRACPSLAELNTSSERACTEIGCNDGFTLTVLPRSGWPLGDYRFELVVDGRAIQCLGKLPLAVCGTASVSCDGLGVSIGESGCALPASQQAFGDIHFEGFPSQIALEILRDDVSELNHEITPTYTGGQPNGAGCAPLCCNGSAEISL